MMASSAEHRGLLGGIMTPTVGDPRWKRKEWYDGQGLLIATGSPVSS